MCSTTVKGHGSSSPRAEEHFLGSPRFLGNVLDVGETQHNHHEYRSCNYMLATICKYDMIDIHIYLYIHIYIIIFYIYILLYIYIIYKYFSGKQL